MIVIENKVDYLKFGIILAYTVKVKPISDSVKSQIQKEIEKFKVGYNHSEKLRVDIRVLLKRGGFKATGRSKPSSEYLVGAAKEDRFPFINNLVDIINYASLKSGFPISLLDLKAIGHKLIIRLGKEKEAYVFNQSGQELGLKGLISLCNENDEPVGSPVKDSMKGKIKEDTKDIVCIVYAPVEYNIDEVLSELETIIKMEAEPQKLEKFTY